MPRDPLEVYDFQLAREQQQRAERERQQADPDRRAFGRLKIRSVDDALNAPPRTYLLDGLIAPGELSVWWGKPKCGKSFLMLRLAYGLAQGRGMWGREAEKVPVLYLASEGESGVNGRIAALHDAMGTAPDFHFIAQRVDLFDPTADLSDLIDACTALGVKLLVIDTLARSMPGGDENKTADMNTFVANCDRLREEGKVHVAIVHHSGWDGEHARGSIALVGAADLVVKVDGEQGAPRSATVEYAKDDESGAALGFTLEGAELPPDAKGRSRSTCIAVENEAPAMPAKGSKAKHLTVTEQGWFDDLRSMFADPFEPQKRVTQPGQVTQVTLTRDQVRDGYRRRGRLGNGEVTETLSGSERKQLCKMLMALKDKGKIGLTNKLVWLL